MTLPSRPARADSVRNRESLLAAAEYEFAASGPDASVADITARAGVGKGTFFRHFATKDDLLAAIVERHVDDLVTEGRQLLELDDAVEALFSFMAMSAERRRQHGVEFLLRAGRSTPTWDDLHDRFLGIVSALLARAQQAGAVRADITPVDIVLLACAPTHIVEPSASGTRAELGQRYLAVILDGLLTPNPRPLPTISASTASL
ncbi:TetR/AcrR family transcriptional regulator [Curtobacterium sp. VKM Ac-2887]|uniref:TetR/AcrR family transcriptional regulator n=1 Tax=Curtobacterium sp. VKM Ac-2887 TaxID=2783819 RepID=UPI00188B603F|nr:TetR/AcrR family transcriptional regulator [Curtobacterium sp. VKM Ac-2887]MBF4588427.1 TetR/AcrR family transcriptional regulator [Curtobacterium sp. VKM Ac-2887]